MKRIFVFVLILGMCGLLQGCETAKGAKKDIEYLFSPHEPDKEYQENLIYRLDNWIKEHMW